MSQINNHSRSLQTIELPVRGMDCVDCTQKIQKSLSSLQGVESTEVFLTAQKAVIRFDPDQVTSSVIRKAVEQEGYSVPLPASPVQTLELPVKGMDCADCTVHVQKAISALAGVESVQVLLSSEKAIIRLDPARATVPAIRQAVERAGYSIPVTKSLRITAIKALRPFSPRFLSLFTEG